MTNMKPMLEFPDEDAPISEWCRPVSGMMINRREATGTSGIEPGSRNNHGGGSHVAVKVKRIRDMKRKGLAL